LGWRRGVVFATEGSARMGDPFVVVVTPVYNGGAYLAETMACVQAQTYPNLAHLVLDNASTDDTPAIIAAYGGQRVPVLVHRNPALLPQIENWNAAFALAPPEADYLRLLCADDTMNPDSIAACVAMAQRQPGLGLVFHNHRNGERLDDFGWPEGESVLEGAALARGFFENRMGFFSTHALLRADVARARAPLFDPSLTGADFEAMLAVMLGQRVGLINRELGWTRVHESSVTSTVMLKMNTHFRDWMTALHRHGPAVFSPAEFQGLTRQFNRHYLRRVLRWRLKSGPEAAIPHLEALARYGVKPDPLAVADALLDWALTKAGLRPPWRGWPA